MKNSQVKLVVIVPKTNTDIVRQVMDDTGAGRIGLYSHQSYSVDGTGRYIPLEGVKPAIGEVEFMVNEQSEMEGALNKILAFAKEQGFSVAPVRGKVIEYIKRNNPEHFNALEEAGVL